MHKRLHLALAALILTGSLGGCVAYPAYPTYGYGYAAPYDSGGYVVLGGGGWYGGNWHHRDWDDRRWHHRGGWGWEH